MECYSVDETIQSQERYVSQKRYRRAGKRKGSIVICSKNAAFSQPGTVAEILRVKQSEKNILRKNERISRKKHIVTAEQPAEKQERDRENNGVSDASVFCQNVNCKGHININRILRTNEKRICDQRS